MVATKNDLVIGHFHLEQRHDPETGKSGVRLSSFLRNRSRAPIFFSAKKGDLSGQSIDWNNVLSTGMTLEPGKTIDFTTPFVIIPNWMPGQQKEVTASIEFSYGPPGNVAERRIKKDAVFSITGENTLKVLYPVDEDIELDID